MVTNKGNSIVTKIAIIDSGISINDNDVKEFIRHSIGYSVDIDGRVLETDGTEVKHEHGTVIAKIIKNVCKNVEFVSINILNERLVTSGALLCIAIKKAITFKPDIIHLSLGTTNTRYNHILYYLILMAKLNQIIIVAADNNNVSVKSYPANLKGIIGVKGSNCISNSKKIFFNDGFFFAPTRILGEICGYDGINCKSICGTSISAAYITGYISNLRTKLGIKKINNIKLIKLFKAFSINTNEYK